MFVIVVVWIFTLNLSLKDSKKNETSYTPFKVFEELVKDAYSISFGSIKEAANQLKTQFQNGGK